MNYYNDNDPRAAAWLRELIKQKLIPNGIVCEKIFHEIKPTDLAGFTQCHFFAGIGGWSRALQLANWPADQPVWTGSCPCQPFSTAGSQKGRADERHLWPLFAKLIAECRPKHVFGEQVASSVGYGWLDGVYADLEAQEYTIGAAVLGAHSVGAPHLRQRLYWVADSNVLQPRGHSGGSCGAGEEIRVRPGADIADGSANGRSPSWSDFELLPYRDGKSRRTEPRTSPLAHGFPSRMGLLRGYGNAIVPEVAEAFITAYLEVRGISFTKPATQLK